MNFSAAERKEIISYFISTLKHAISKDDILAVYQVGTSVISEENANDIDLIIIANDRHHIRSSFIKVISSIRSGHVSVSEPYYSYNSVIKKTLCTVIKEVTSRYDVRFTPYFIIGPLPPLHDQEIAIHICVLMSKMEADLLFKYLPFHGLAFLNVNRKIFGPDLTGLMSYPNPSYNEYIQFINALYDRGKRSTCSAFIEKCARKIILTKFLYERFDNAYDMTNKFFKNLSYKENSKKILSYSYEMAFNCRTSRCT